MHHFRVRAERMFGGVNRGCLPISSDYGLAKPLWNKGSRVVSSSCDPRNVPLVF